MSVRTRNMRALFVMLSAAALLFLTVASVFAGIVGSSSNGAVKTSEPNNDLPVPLCLFMEPVGRRIHDGFAIRKEWPKLPSFECVY
jgi:hypothetical protein